MKLFKIFMKNHSLRERNTQSTKSDRFIDPRVLDFFSLVHDSPVKTRHEIADPDHILITLIFGANPCKIHSYCLFCIGSSLILHKKCIDFRDPHFRDIAAPKSDSHFKGKMTFHSRFFPTAPLMSGGHRKVYERSRIESGVGLGTFRVENFIFFLS